MTVCKWNLENGGNKLIFHTAKPQAHFLTKLCFYYTSASEGRRGGGTGTMQPWSYPSGMIPAHPHSHLKVEYTLFHQKGHTVTWVPVQKLSIEQVFLSIWLNNVEFFFTKGRRLWGHTESDTTSDLAAAVYWKHICELGLFNFLSLQVVFLYYSWHLRRYHPTKPITCFLIKYVLFTLLQ